MKHSKALILVLEDEQVIRRLTSENWKSAFIRFRELFYERKRVTDAWFLRRCGLERYAEDVVQDSFMKLYQDRLKHLKYTEYDATKLLRFLYRVNRNACIDIIRKYGSEKTLDPEVMKLQESRSMNSETLTMITEAFEKLPKHQRDVLILRCIHALSLMEVAELMNRSVGWVWEQEKRGFRRLRRIFEEDNK